MSLLNVLRLKLIDLMSARGLLILLLIIPPLLGMISGTANKINQNPAIVIACVDNDQTQASQDLIKSLTAQGWSIQPVTAGEAEKLLIRHKIDGLITIRKGYAAQLASLDSVKLSYTAAEGSMITNMVREAIAAIVLPAHARLKYLQSLDQRSADSGQSLPDNFIDVFNDDVEYYSDHQARLEIVYHGSAPAETAVSHLVSDYSMEIFFLGIYAVLGTIALSGRNMRRRLLATSRGMLMDFCSTIAALFILGVAQILLYTAAMLFLMQAPVNLTDLGVLAVCLFTLLSLSQLLSMLHESIRLFTSLMVLLILAVASGCFFELSQQLMTSIGQYLPQGWALAALLGYPVLPFYIPVLAGLLMLTAGYCLQVRRSRASQ